MPSQFLVEFASPSPSAVVWADTTDFSVTGITRTHQIDLTSLASGAARQGAKADLGANPADEYIVECAFEFGGSAPTIGLPMMIYFGFSDNATAGTLNPGGLSGTDAAGITTATGRSQLFQAGLFPVLASGAGTVQRMQLSIIRPPARYVMPNVYNGTDQALDSDAINMYVRLLPRVVEAQ